MNNLPSSFSKQFTTKTLRTTLAVDNVISDACFYPSLQFLGDRLGTYAYCGGLQFFAAVGRPVGQALPESFSSYSPILNYHSVSSFQFVNIFYYNFLTNFDYVVYLLP